MKSRVKKIKTMSEQKQPRALLSVYDKSYAFERLVRALCRAGYELIASGGTYKFIKERMVESVTHAGEITDLKPVPGKENVLDHRVETLCPQLHGGLLADEVKHLEELAQLDWPFIDMVVCTFYPLAKTMEEKAGDFESINNQVDIGGPTLVRSACKGGRAVVVDENDFEFVSNQLDLQQLGRQDKLWLQTKAAATITAYIAMESVFRLNQIRPRTEKR